MSPDFSPQSPAQSAATLTPEQTLEAEREHLQHARSCLTQMRISTAALTDAGAANALTAESLGKLRAIRLRALEQASTAPPFFGRLDLDPTVTAPDELGAGQGAAGRRDQDQGSQGVHGIPETIHVGRRHIRDEAGDPVVIDWRAPLSTAFYRATTTDPHGVALRRRFGFDSGELTSFEDERLDVGTIDPLDSTILREEIERPRVGPMRDIVATIQPDQNDIVRAPLETDVCVQGAPGTGKTAVGLHRAAYLLYTYPERLARSRVLVVGPNLSFLAYIGAVLPALGEFDVDQASIETLTSANTKIRGTDAPEVARLKGDARMAEVLAKALRAGIRKPTEAVRVPLAGRGFRVEANEVLRLVDDLRRGDYAYGVARDRIALGLAEHARRSAESSGLAPTDAQVRAAARHKDVQAAVEQVWPAVTGPLLVHRLLSDSGALARAARGILTEDEQALVLWDKPPASAARARWSSGDAVLIDEVTCLLQRPTSYGHVVLDEAQDLSPMQCRAVARRAAGGSLTVLGDIAQGTSDWASSSWAETLVHLGRPEAVIEPLTLGYRVPGEVIDYANRLLPQIAPELPASTSVRPGIGSLGLRPVQSSAAAALAEAVTTACRELLALAGTTAVICADASVTEVRTALREAGLPAASLDEEHIEVVADAGERLDIVPATLAKGLEFDHVVLVEPADIVDAEHHGLRRLYVCLTRAVTTLRVVHHRAIPVP